MKQRADTPRDWAIVVYSVLGLAVVFFPGGALDFLEERNGGGWLTVPIQAMKAVASVSAAIGFSEVGEDLRRAFAAVIEPDEGP